MKNEMNETLIFYLIKKSVFSSLFHFVIPALAPMFSLDEFPESYAITLACSLYCLIGALKVLISCFDGNREEMQYRAMTELKQLLRY